MKAILNDIDLVVMFIFYYYFFVRHLRSRCGVLTCQFKRVRFTVINGDTIRIQIKISGPLQHPIPTKWPSWKTHLKYFRHIVINDELMETQAALTNCMKINQHKRYKNYFTEFHVTCCKTLGPMTARRKKKSKKNQKQQQQQQKTQKTNKQYIHGGFINVKKILTHSQTTQ